MKGFFLTTDAILGSTLALAAVTALVLAYPIQPMTDDSPAQLARDALHLRHVLNSTGSDEAGTRTLTGWSITETAGSGTQIVASLTTADAPLQGCACQAIPCRLSQGVNDSCLDSRTNPRTYRAYVRTDG